MSLFDDPLPPSCHLKSPFSEPPPPLHVGDVLCERPHKLLFSYYLEVGFMAQVFISYQKKSIRTNCKTLILSIKDSNSCPLTFVRQIKIENVMDS